MEYIKNDKQNVANVQLSTVNERISMGNKLYVAAWIFEIVAATIGLYVAWTTGNNISVLEGNISPEQQAQIILGSLPFIMVALAELLKIPIVYLVYINRNIRTKVFFSIILFGLTIITFETLASAFENQFTNITHKIQEPQDTIDKAKINIAKNKEKIQKANSITSASPTEDHEKEVSNLTKVYSLTLITFEDRKKSIEKSLTKGIDQKVTKLNQSIVNFPNRRLKEILLLKDIYKEAKKSRIDEFSKRVERRKNKIDRLNYKIKMHNSAIKQQNASAKGSSLPWCKDDKQCNKNYSAIDELEDKLSNIPSVLEVDETVYYSVYTKELAYLNEHLDKELLRLDGDIVLIQKNKKYVLNNDADLTEIKSKISSLIGRHNQNLKTAEAGRIESLESLKLKKEEIKGWEAEILIIESKIKKLDEILREHAAYTQVWRFTKYRIGKTPSLDEVTTTAFWWYGSLAVLVSIMGVVLAFGALILRHPKEKYKELNPEKRHRLKNTIRRMFVSLRKRIREPKIVTKTIIKEVPKEVIKEVPVQKVVLTEVPVEIIKKEIFYEPLYTKDPDLLKFGTAKVRDILSKFGKGKDKKTDKGNKDN
jgi:hypothetical protein